MRRKPLTFSFTCSHVIGVEVAFLLIVSLAEAEQAHDVDAALTQRDFFQKSEAERITGFIKDNLVTCQMSQK